MRFIAVFNQLHTASGLGFDSLLDAVDFLFWGYEDHELMPLGVYDLLTDQATPYEHAGQPMNVFSPESIRSIGKDYLTTISQLAGFLRPADG